MLRNILLGTVIASFGSIAMAGCPAPTIPKKANEAINFKKVNQTLFSDLAVEWTNYYRCQAGQASVKDSSRMSKASAAHSKNMAKYDVLSHETRASGQQTLKKRLRRAGVRTKRYSENISYYFSHQFSKQRFSSVDWSACEFSQGGKRVPRHTYASLAKLVVTDWVNSAAHRRNSLNPYYNLSGAGVSITYTEEHPCGKVFVTQTFAN